jgi:4-hydroxy-3-polyprenylbenzoate decarboxylase
LFDVLQPQAEMHVIISVRGGELLKLELDLTAKYFAKENVTVYKNSKINASIASGSFAVDAMVVVPSSMGTIGRIAAGTSQSLIERAADVALKERNKLILVPRESPFNQIHLKNMLTLDQAGAVILPANPAFYQNPQTVDDLVDFVVARILNQLGVDHDLTEPYKP